MPVYKLFQFSWSLIATQLRQPDDWEQADFQFSWSLIATRQSWLAHPKTWRFQFSWSLIATVIDKREVFVQDSAFNSPGVLLQRNPQLEVSLSLSFFQFSWSLIATGRGSRRHGWRADFQFSWSLIATKVSVLAVVFDPYFQFSWSLIATNGCYCDSMRGDALSILLESYCNPLTSPPSLFSYPLSILLESYCNMAVQLRYFLP